VPGIEDRLRRDLDRLAKSAEATGSLARVARRKRRHRTARRVQAAALAAVVLAATAGGGYALTRAFRRGEAPDVVAPPSPSSEPKEPKPTEASPSPVQTAPSPPQPSREMFEIKFGKLCGFTGAIGNFDGDRIPDSAAVAFAPSGGSCPDEPPEDAWWLHVIWGSGPSGAWPLDDCDRACRSFGIADLDGNGTDEFFLVIDAGAATEFLHVYELAIGPQPKHPIEVAPPGAAGYPANEPALFPYGGSVTHQDFVTCDEGDGVHILIATSAELDQNAGEWSIRETILSLDGEVFTVVSTRDYQVAFDPSGQEPLPVPGDACFALD
jgi:hypothetical protein